MSGLTSETETVVDFSCEFDCVNGYCSGRNTCSCDDGWGGRLCDMLVEYCMDGHACLNGSTCTPKGEGTYGKQEYTCDCSHISQGIAVYVGDQCQYAAEEICEYGKSKSTTAFCVNSGRCHTYTVPDSDSEFKGCICPDEYEGDHCEYLIGQVPANYYSRSNSSNQQNSPLSRFAFIFTTALVGMVVLLFLFGLIRNVINSAQHKQRSTQPIQSAADHDLQIEPDGQVLKEAMGESSKESSDVEEQQGNGVVGYEDDHELETEGKII